MRSASILTCCLASAAVQPAAVMPGSACMPPLQLVDTLSLLRRRGPSLPLHSRWTPALPHPSGLVQVHGQQSQSCTMRSSSAQQEGCCLSSALPVVSVWVLRCCGWLIAYSPHVVSGSNACALLAKRWLPGSTTCAACC